MNSLKSNFKQFGLLTWKNYVIQKRSIFGLILELVLPALFAAILLPIRGIVKSQIYPNDTIFNEFGVTNLPFDLKLPNVANQWYIGYSPNISFSKQIMEIVAIKLTNPSVNLFLKGFKTEDEMSSYNNSLITDQELNKTLARLAGIAFLDLNNKTLDYKIRLSYSSKANPDGGTNVWKTDTIYPSTPTMGPRDKYDPFGGEPGYYDEAFLAIQSAIESTYIGLTTNNTIANLVDKILLKRFPYPPYNDDAFTFVIQATFPFILMISFVFTVILTSKAIVNEKESGLKEAMKLMGMKPWLYWLSWYVKTFLLLLPAVVFKTIAFKVKLPLKGGGTAAILDHSDTFIIIIFFLLYMSSSITFTLLITTLFKKGNSAAAGSGIIWFLTYLPFVFLQLRYESTSFGLKILAAFVNNLGMGESIQLIGFFESKGVGINWSNINEPVSVNDNLTFLHCLLISLATSFIHLFIFYYLEQILPGDNGIARKWYFPIEFLMPNSTNDTDKVSDLKPDKQGEVFIESDEVYSSRKAGIKINNITKTFKQFGKLKTAVNNLALKIYENHITVLLGHNGAGKSTTISMITGITCPTSGQILVNDHDIVTDTRMARKQIGYCPQYNLLFDEMTVMEHLKFFAKLKENYDPKEAQTILEDLNLADKANALSKTLSGGMKRKLSVAIAFIGGSKIVILDEPTSGMDPQARHATWTVLQKFKQEKQCSILLTTHFMDEADFLGDRIAIMSRGSLRCCGSPLYLKSKYDSGYNLVINKKTQQIGDDLSSKYMNVIQKHVPNAKLNSNINSEISFMLPKEDALKFAELFNDLEYYKTELDIINIGVSVTTVEEVFLKIGDLEDCEELNEEETNLNGLNGQENKGIATLDVKNTDDFGLFAGLNSEDRNDDLVTKYFQQFYALVIKKFIHSLRNKILVVSQLIVPIATLFLILVLVKYGPIKLEDSKALNITLGSYRQNYIPFKSLNTNNAFLSDLTTVYQSQFTTALNLNKPVVNCTSSTSSIDDYLSCIGQIPDIGLGLYTDNYIVGATFESNSSILDASTKIIGHFNNQPYHAPPLTFNLITNSIFKYLTKSNRSQINVINHPMPRTLDEKINDIQKLGVVGGFQIASTVTFGFSFLISSFAVFLIKERVSNAKHMQYLTGANPIIFWLSNLFWDIINYLIPSTICILLILAFGIYQYTGNRMFIIIALFIFYGFAHIPQTYLISYLFKNSATGFAVTVAWNILTSQTTIVAVYFLQLPTLGLTNEGDILEWLFMIFLPNFAFGQALTDVYVNYEYNDFCGKNDISSKLVCTILPNPCCIKYGNCGKNSTADCIRWTPDYVSWDKPGVGRYFLFMPLQFIVLFSLVLLYELGILRKLFYRLKNALNLINPVSVEVCHNGEELYGDIPKDADVLKEEIRIDIDKSDLLCIDRLAKNYSNFMAVRGISLGIKASECFGLLGVNGAGKTTTFKMITGDEVITRGDVSLNRTSIKRNINSYQKQIGYCPQFDPLIERMTCLETLKLFSRLRGIKEHLIRRTCLSLINILDLSDHTNKMVQTLSGGNKRKLSVGISLVGSPNIVLLDEPTSGMDPKTRRFLWNCLNNIREKGKSLILTSHSMEETEALCTRMGIMVNGELKCLGNLQHLKSVYGDGYTLLVKITCDKNDLIKVSDDFIETINLKFGNCVLKENRDGFVNMQIKENSIKMLGSIFSLIEEIKFRFFIEYYFVTQTKLEQIFLNFASRQIDPSSRFTESKSCKFLCLKK